MGVSTGHAVPVDLGTPPVGRVVVYDHQDGAPPDESEQLLAEIREWAAAERLEIIAECADTEQGERREVLRHAFEHAVALLSEHPDARMLVHSPRRLDGSPAVRQVLTNRIGGRVRYAIPGAPADDVAVRESGDAS